MSEHTGPRPDPGAPTTGGRGADADGRRQRGRRRREAIIDATLAVIEDLGVAGVSHRSVATVAGVPASSVTYHFATLDDLLVAALTAAAADYQRQFDELVADGHDELDAIAELTVAAGGAGRRRALAERELTMMAARRPPLRPIASHWRDLVARAAARRTDDPVAIATAVAAADGACATVLLSDVPVTVVEVRRILDRALADGPRDAPRR